ncbi:Adenosine deaminase [Elusimicrobium minutum Pei191]|uniref:adenosine deaminase n=1 Tax=Elusimicrobium minutum (strain Pei191) TaxID=445932 RepID=B2KDW8_ELUMP|nr:adenosine deaminase family protein [Elusimicrobium minutum]ACC98714.1 Adenosine deaminase [Elusimicrobium minutum Pei191]
MPDMDFITKIPKTDLHVHLDGSMRLSTLIELAKKDKIELPDYTEDGLRKKVFKPKYNSLVEYLKGFNYTTLVMQSRSNIERIAYELAKDNIAEGVRYIEVRFAPQLHTAAKMTSEEALRSVAKGLKKAADEHNNSKVVKTGEDIKFYFGIIACAMRSFNENMSPYYRRLLSALSHAPKDEAFAAASMELARTVVRLVNEEHLPIVGFDLAGQEEGYPAEDHKKAYQFVHKHFIRKTVHAGEAYGPESIFQAITDCHANRIGHGTFLFATDMIKDKSIKDRKKYVEDLSTYIASERIGVEVCLTSNLQTNPAIKTISDHPVKEMIKRGLSVSICTDNRLVSNTTVSKELKLLSDNFKLTKQEFRNIIIAGFKGAFFPGNYNDKRTFVRNAVKKYNKLTEEVFK